MSRSSAEQDLNHAGFYVVQEVIGERNTGGETEYKVRWEGYGPDDDTWEPVATLARSAPRLLAAYVKGRRGKPTTNTTMDEEEARRLLPSPEPRSEAEAAAKAEVSDSFTETAPRGCPAYPTTPCPRPVQYPAATCMHAVCWRVSGPRVRACAQAKPKAVGRKSSAQLKILNDAFAQKAAVPTGARLASLAEAAGLTEKEVHDHFTRKARAAKAAGKAKA
jgi:hypothetical protein